MIITARTPASRHVSTASLTSGRAGSIIPTNPSRVSPDSSSAPAAISLASGQTRIATPSTRTPSPASRSPAATARARNGLATAAGDAGRVALSWGAWATLGMALAVLMRSAPIALGAGIAWSGPFEHLL